MNITCGILTGGKNSRMGSNKAYLKWNGVTFLDVIASELKEFDQFLVSVDRKEKYENLSYDLVEDENIDIGPMEGIRQLLNYSKNRYVFVCACDMPFIKRELVDYIGQFISSDYDCYVITDEDRVHPLCGVYSKQMLTAMEEMIGEGNYKLMNLLKRVNCKYIDINQSCYSNQLLRNINTKEEYLSLKKPVIFCVSGVKNSGKTSLIVSLIQELKQFYTKIGVIKHDGHDFEMDHQGTDTWKFSKAGAEQVSIFSIEQYAVIAKKQKVSILDMIEMMLDMEIIIIEGLKDSDFPKIEVVRKEISENIVCKRETLIAVVSDILVQGDVGQVPIIELNNYKGIVERIREFIFEL